jgi:4'-phosphopantetheinyl transferase
VAVVRGARVGVDVQRYLPEDLGTARAEGWLADAEHDAIARLPEQDRAAALGRCWAAKEALLKGRGVGLLVDPSTVDTVSRSTVGGWRLLPVPAPAGHAAAVAVRHRSRLPRPVVVHVADEQAA